LTCLNISANAIGAGWWYLNPKYEADPTTEYKYLSTTGRKGQAHGRKGQDDEPACGVGPLGAIALAAAIENNGALVKLDASDNNMFGYSDQSGMRAWAVALKANASLLELNLAKNDMNANDAKIFADGVSTNGALEKLLMGANGLKGEETGKALGDAIATNTTLRELDLSGNWDGKLKCDANFVKGFAVGLGANGALVKFDISANSICAEGGRHLAAALTNNQIMTELNIAANNLGKESSDRRAKADMSAVVAISNAIPTMGALTSLIIRNNSIGHRRLQRITTLCKIKGIALDSEGNDPSSEYDEIADNDDD
jgi:Ran GTPase-activating protein (RanGAP) involved in mRNA processing and transport